jgi:hypothetical protein
VARCDLLEKILEARYEFDYAPKEAKERCQRRLFELVDQAIDGTDVSRHELLTTIFARYLLYKKDRRRKEIVSISQRLRS